MRVLYGGSFVSATLCSLYLLAAIQYTAVESKGRLAFFEVLFLFEGIFGCSLLISED